MAVAYVSLCTCVCVCVWFEAYVLPCSVVIFMCVTKVMCFSKHSITFSNHNLQMWEIWNSEWLVLFLWCYKFIHSHVFFLPDFWQEKLAMPTPKKVRKNTKYNAAFHKSIQLLVDFIFVLDFKYTLFRLELMNFFFFLNCQGVEANF